MFELKDLDIALVARGDVIETFNEALARAARDLIDRDKVGKKRTVTLAVELVPDEENPRMPKINWEVKVQVPGYKGDPCRAWVENGSLMVMDEPEQAELFNNVTKLKESE